MAVDTLSLFTLLGLTIVIGYVGMLIFRRTKISDVIWLLLFGIIVGPVLGLVDRALFLSLSPFLSSAALLIILFDAGLNMDFYQLVRNAPRGILLSAANVALSMTAVGFFATSILRFDLLSALLLGAIIGGTSSPVVISIVDKAKIGSRTKTVLELESIFTDPLVIVIALAILNLMTQTSALSPFQHVLSTFSIGAFIGLLAGIVWLFMLQRIRKHPFDYMITLAVLLLVYTMVEAGGGSGAIASLFFGLVLGNGYVFSKLLKTTRKRGADPLIKSVQSEISFFIRSFFFVFLGLIVAITADALIIGLIITSILIVVRFVAAEMSIIGMKVTHAERNVMRVMTPRGLAAAVLAQFPLAFGLPHGEIFSNIVFTVIIATVIYTTAAVHFSAPVSTGKSDTEKQHKKAQKQASGKK